MKVKLSAIFLCLVLVLGWALFSSAEKPLIRPFDVKLNDLDDLNIGTLSDADILEWDSTTLKWISATHATTASSDIDHDGTANFVADEHIAHSGITLTAAGLITGGGTIAANRTFTLTEATIESAIDTLGAVNFTGDVDFVEDVTWTLGDAADRIQIIQGNAAGIEAQPLIYINDDRVGTTANEKDEATIQIDSEGPDSWALYVSTSKVQFDADFILDYASSDDNMTITQSSESGTEDQALILITDAREGATVDETSEATLRIQSEGFGLAVIGKTYLEGDIEIVEDLAFTWGSAADKMTIAMSNATGVSSTPLINIDDDRTGSNANEVGEATIVLNAAGTYGLYVETGEAYFAKPVSIHDIFTFTMDSAGDQSRILQTSATGTEDQVLILIDDDRTGATANESSEATLHIATNAVRALLIDGGTYGIELDGNAGIDSAGPVVIRTWFHMSSSSTIHWDSRYDDNTSGDDLLIWKFSAPGANESAGIFYSLIDPAGMTDHDNYLSPTFILANDEGADVYDYAAVVIGERAQSNVKIAHYFDFYAMTGSADGSVDTADEIAAIFRFGASGSATPGYAVTPGDVLFEGSIEVDGSQHVALYNRADYITWNDCFDHGSTAAKYGQDWDLTSLNTQGGGSNTIQTNPSHITLTTDSNGVGDDEGTRTDYQIISRAEYPRTEFGVALGQTANTKFYCGWNDDGLNAMVAAADKYVIVFFDKSSSDYWQIKVGDGSTEDVYTSSIAADTSHIRHEIWAETDGTIHWSANGTELNITGSVDNKMDAADHYLIVGHARSVTGAAAIVAEIHYVELEKIKSH